MFKKACLEGLMTSHQLTLTLLETEAAEPAAREVLEATREALGFVPNMYAAMANSPALLDSYVHGYGQFRQGSALTPVEQEVVLLAISVDNQCSYCVAAHSFVADAMSKVPKNVTDAIRAGELIPDQRLAALAQFTAAMLDTRGRPSAGEVAAFLDAGYEERHVLSVILAIAVKTLSNYTNHFFDTDVDPAFASRSWTSAELEPTT